jgi:hypothetical protein
MNRFARRRACAVIGLPALLCLSMGMRFPGAPGDCLMEDANWASVEGGCKDLSSGRVWSSTYFTNIPAEPHPNFYEAQAYCDNLDEGGYTDWRLATITEMQNADANGALGRIRDAYPDTSKWSGTTDKGKKNAWTYNFTTNISNLTGIYTPRNGGIYSRHDSVCVR